jgi:tRNA-dihydrouridine synthase B
MLQIGPYTTVNAVALAPMAGVTDLPFRRLCARFGAGLLVGEMVHSNRCPARLAQESPAQHPRPGARTPLGTDRRQRPGADGRRGALQPRAWRPDHRYQHGLPGEEGLPRAAGSALLADERLVGAILRAVVEAVDAPVTLKIRTGIDPAHRNGPTIARIAEDAGIALLSVHGRTRACGFTGAVEHDTTARIVEAVDIPVLANGDIRSIAFAAP